MADAEFRILHLEDNQVNALVVRKMLEAADSPTFTVFHADTLLKALDLLSQHQFDAALLDLNVPDSSGIETFLAIHRNAPGLAVVVLSGCDSDALAMKAVELGAQDYLRKTQLNKGELTRSLQYSIIRSRKTIQEQRIEAAPPGTIIGFLGSKGGVGTSMLACHVARAMAKETGDRVLLTGFDLSSAGIAYLMRSATKYTVVDVSQNLHRLDADLWKALVHATDYGVDVLAPPGSAEFLGPVDAERIRHMLRMGRIHYRRIVLDLGQLTPLSLSLLEETHQVYVVSTEELPALWEAGRLMGRLSHLGLGDDRLRLVVNQKRKRGGLPVSDLEKALGHSIYASVTAAHEEQTELMANGRFIEEKSQIGAEANRLVLKILGKEETAAGRSGFRLGRLVEMSGF